MQPPPRDPAAADAARAAFRRVFPGVMVAMYLAAADQTVLASALPAIASALGGVADLSWVVVGYLLAATVAAPLYGYLGDRFGRRRMLLFALAVFTLASLACALAPNFLVLVAFRALQGLGGGGLMALAQSLIGEHVPPRERGRFAGYFAMVFALASTTGPVLGAYLTELVGWRAIFAVNLPLGLVAAVLALGVPRAPIPARHAAHRLDGVGALLFCAGTAAFVFALSSGGHRFAWASWPMAALVSGAGACLALLVAWERRHPDPLLPPRLLRIPAIARSNVVVFCFAAALFPVVVYLPLYLQLGRGIGIGASGALLLPVTLAQVTAAAVTGRLVSHTGHVDVFPIAGLATAAAGLTALGAGAAAAGTPTVLGLAALVGAGLGMVMPPTQIRVQTAAGREALGVATATISLSRAIGGAVGVALVGAVLFAQADAGEGAALLHRAMEGGSAYVAQMPEGARAQLAARVDAIYRVAFLVMAAIATTGAAVAATVPRFVWHDPTDPR
ncbi:MAG: DHA2 family efflux MFS transporter permease subunit [Burkholderiales bacterium]